MVSGVSGGLAAYFDVDPVLVRLLWVAGAVLSGGVLLLVYLALWVLVPEEPPVPQSTLRAGDRSVTFETGREGDEIPDGGLPGEGSEAEAAASLPRPACNSAHNVPARTGYVRALTSSVGTPISVR